MRQCCYKEHVGEGECVSVGVGVGVSVSVGVGVGVGVGVSVSVSVRVSVSTYSAAHSCPRSGEGRGRAGSLPGLPPARHQRGSWASSTLQTIAGPQHMLWLAGSQCPAQEYHLFTVTMMSQVHAGCVLERIRHFNLAGIHLFLIVSVLHIK